MNRLIKLKQRALVFLILFAFACLVLSIMAQGQSPLPPRTPIPLPTPEPFYKFMQRTLGRPVSPPASQPRPTWNPILFHTPIPTPTPLPIHLPPMSPIPIVKPLQDQVNDLKNQVATLQNQLNDLQKYADFISLVSYQTDQYLASNITELQARVAQFYQEYQGHGHQYYATTLNGWSVQSFFMSTCETGSGYNQNTVSPTCVGGSGRYMTLLLYAPPAGPPPNNSGGPFVTGQPTPGQPSVPPWEANSG